MKEYTLITGASSGIGYEMAKQLASKNYNLLLVARSEDKLLKLQQELKKQFNIEVEYLLYDLSEPNSAQDLYKQVQERKYLVTGLINNAGFGINKAFSTSQMDAEQQMFDVLVRTPMRLMHTIIPGMKERKSGIIINNSSVASFIAGGTYSAAKSYMTVLSESMNTELASSGVKVSALCPGFTRTEFHERGRMKMGGLPNFMWLNADKLVAQSWKDALANKPVSIPGWQYKLLVGVISTIPRKFVRQIGMNVRKKQR